MTRHAAGSVQLKLRTEAVFRSRKQVGPNKYVRKGPMPGTVQAGAVQAIKNIGDEIFGQGFSNAVSDSYDYLKNTSQSRNIEN